MNLVEAMKYEYASSKLWLSASLVLTTLFYLCSIVTAVASGTWVKWGAFMAFLLQLLIAAARARSGALYSLGESVRPRHLA